MNYRRRHVSADEHFALQRAAQQPQLLVRQCRQVRVFAMDGDEPDMFDRTVAWAVEQGIETAAFHIMTSLSGHRPLPAHGGTGPHVAPRRGTLRHPPSRVPPDRADARQLEDYWRAYRDFYRWRDIWRGAAAKPASDRLRYLAYSGGRKKFEPLWDVLIRSGQVLRALPILESLLGSFGARQPTGGGRYAGQDRRSWLATR